MLEELAEQQTVLAVTAAVRLEEMELQIPVKMAVAVERNRLAARVVRARRTAPLDRHVREEWVDKRALEVEADSSAVEAERVKAV